MVYISYDNIIWKSISYNSLVVDVINILKNSLIDMKYKVVI